MLNANILPKNFMVSAVEKDVIRKKITTRNTEKWEVAQLNSSIEPCSKPSDLFEKLEEKRKIRHENLLKQLAKSLHDVNLKTEKNITMSSVELKAHAKDFDDKLKDILKSIDIPEVASYCSSVFLEFQNKANEYKSQQQKLVNELYGDLIKFESERTNENEKLLRLACEEMRKIGYFLPYEVQTFVEHETLKMNQLSLNNRRCYEDLKLTLTLVTEQTFKCFMDKVFCIREKWVHRKLQKTFCNLQSKAEKKLAKFIPEAYARLEIKGQELIVQLLPNNLYSTCKAEEWSKNVEEVVATIDTYGKNLINVYKKAIKAVYHGFDAEVEEIKSELNFVEPLAIEERIIKPIVFETQNEQNREIEDLEIYWQETLDDIRMHLKDVTQFLLDAGKLWDRHTERVCESKKLILRALEKADKNNQAVLQDLEIKLNISLDSLRQEHNQSKLEKAYETVVAVLDSLKAKYESMYLDDVSTVEDFYKMMKLEADVLSADIKEFIYETHVIDHGKIVHCYTDQYRYYPEGKPIFKEIQLCAQQIQAVTTWKQGVWVALETLSEKTSESLSLRAEAWVQKKIEDLAEKKSIQLELLEKRFQRVRVEIYEKRSTEIQTHQEMLDKHKEKVEFALTKIKEDFQSLVARELNNINFIKESLTEIEANAMLENRPGVLRGNQIMMERKKEELENGIKMTYERFRADCDIKTSEMKQANINFMKSIKLFHENGNYSSEEGKMFITLLEVVDREINTDFKNLVKELAKEESDLIRKLSAIFNPLIFLFSLLYEETLFNQEIRQKLQNFTADIQDAAKSLKLDFDFLSNQCYFLCKSVKDSEDPSYEVDEKFWNFIIQLLYKNVSNLLYPISIPETLAPSVSLEEKGEGTEGEASTVSPCCCVGKFPLYVTSSKTATFRTSDKEDAFTCKDYRYQLFNCAKPPENDGTFMAVMCNNFWEEMSSLQKAACNFYKKLQGRKIIREDLIQANYDMFVSEILLKFKYYNTQIEQFWLQIISDFLPLLGRVKSLANSFLKRKLHGYEDAAFKALVNFESDFVTCLESQHFESLKELETLNKKLLPLHGFPHNAHLLDELEEEVVRKTANQEIQREAAIRKFKRQLKCFQEHHIKEKVEINQIKIYYVKLRDAIFVNDLAENLLDTILDHCSKEEFYIKKVSSRNLTFKREGENESSKVFMEIPEEHKLDLDVMDINQQSVQNYLQQLREVIEKERSSGNKPSCAKESIESFQGEDFGANCGEAKLNILLKILDFEKSAGKILEKIGDYVRALKAYSDSQTKSRETELFDWLNNWKFNVKKVRKLYRVKYEERPETSEETLQAQSENNKPKTKKTSASVTSTLPRLCPTTKLDLKDISCNIPKLKSRSLGNRLISNENKTLLGVVEQSKTNLQKSKLTKLNNSEQVELTNNASLFLNSPRNYHGQIPVLHRHSLNLVRMSPPDTRSPSPLKKQPPKEKSSNKVKTITLDQDTKKKKKTSDSRSPSPVKRAPGNYKKSKSKILTSSVVGNFKNSEKLEETKRPDSTKQTSPTKNSTKRKSKSKVLSSSNLEFCLKDKSGAEFRTPVNDSNSVVLKQTSQPSLSTKNKRLQPQGKISLDHLKNEVYSGDHRRLSFEKVHLCIEKSVENLGLGEKKRSYLVTYASEDVQNKEEISLAFLQNLTSKSIRTYSTDGEKAKFSEETSELKSGIKTPSGHELILTPSMESDIEKDELSNDDKEISRLLQETVDFEDQKEVHILQDDANEYDSEISTDGEMAEEKKQLSPARLSGSKCSDLHKKGPNSFWRSREVDFLNDVDYRQAVYHPAVSRRQKCDNDDMEFMQKSKSIESNFGFPNKTTETIVRSRSSNLKNTCTLQDHTTSKMGSNNNERSWGSGFDKTDGKTMYNSALQDVPFYGMKKIRTRKERISGALLRFTLKVIRLLAIFNLWPGDNCHMLTSQSLRFAR